MSIYHLAYVACWLLVLVPVMPGLAASPDQGLADSRVETTATSSVPDPPPPALTDVQKRFLMRVARRTLRAALSGQPTYEPDYIPSSLRDMKVEVVLRVRHQGYQLAAASSGPLPIALAIRDAARTASEMLRRDRPDVDLSADGLLVEIEVVGPAVVFTVKGDWTKYGVIDPYVEPGIHGIVLLSPRDYRRFCPTEVITSDRLMADALAELAKGIVRTPAETRLLSLMRFRTVHFYQLSAGEAIVSLVRGMTLVPPEDVRPAAIDRAVDRLVAHMLYRQQPTGLFAYQYEAALDRYTEENNLIRQLGVAAGLAEYARLTGRQDCADAAARAIRFHLQGRTPVPGVEDASYLATADGEHKLGVTALCAVALAAHPDTQAYEETRRSLIRGILTLQGPEGYFLTAFKPGEHLGAQDHFPGQALLALAMDYGVTPSAEVLDAFDRALNTYRIYFHARPNPSFVPWQARAFARMARHTKRSDFAAFAFELCDYLIKYQLDETNCSWPDLYGGIAASQAGRPGFASAAYLEALADALTLAREVGDHERARRYARAAVGLTRFVLQLQVRPEEAYFVKSLQSAVGGIRTSPSSPTLRIDHCTHALIGLVSAKNALFGEVD